VELGDRRVLDQWNPQSGQLRLPADREPLARHGLTRSPRHLAKFNVRHATVQRKRYSRLGNPIREQTDDGLHDADWRHCGRRGCAWVLESSNFTLFSRNLVKNLEFSASVYNLLDRKYGRSGQPLPPTGHHRARWENLPPETDVPLLGSGTGPASSPDSQVRRGMRAADRTTVDNPAAASSDEHPDRVHDRRGRSMHKSGRRLSSLSNQWTGLSR